MRTDPARRRRARALAAAEHAVLSASLAQSQDGILVSAGGEVLWWSEALLRMWNLPESVLREGDNEAAIAAARRQAADPVFFDQFVRPDFRPRPGKRDLLPMNDGRVFERFRFPFARSEGDLGEVLIFRDVTESLRQADALARQVRQQAAIVALSKRALGEASVDAYLLEVCSTVRQTLRTESCAFFAAERERLAIQVEVGIDDPEAVRALEGIAQSAFDSGEPTHGELHQPSMQAVAVPVSSPSRRIGVLVAARSGLLGLADEVEFLRTVSNLAAVFCEQARAVAALRQSELNLRSLVEKAPDAMYVHDGERILFANPKLAQLLGRPPDEVIGMRVLEMIAPEDRALVSERIAGHLAGTGSTEPVERLLVDASGRARPLEFVGMRIDFEGRPAVLAVGRDVSERKEMQRRLAIADRMASAGTLAAGVAHELNNPLAFVRANLEYLIEALPLSERSEARQALSEARTGAVRMQEIVRGMKLFSRVEEVTELGPVGVREVIESAARLAHNEIRHRARLELNLDEVPAVRANEARLAQVLVNLLVNAAQAIPVGSADANWIRLTARQEGEQVAIEIADTGSGIPPHVLKRIFDPFFTTKPVGVGTGLGLSICHGIITGFGGQISVESEPGKGTRVLVSLPVEKEAVVEQPSGKRAQVAARGRILVIDDEPFVTRAVRRALEPLGEVVMLNEARRAVELIAQERPFDVILCDLMMPEMTGMELYESLEKSNPELAQRVIFMSGGAFTSAARGFLERFPNARVDKPFEVDALRAIVASRLRSPGPVV